MDFEAEAEAVREQVARDQKWQQELDVTVVELRAQARDACRDAVAALARAGVPATKVYTRHVGEIPKPARTRNLPPGMSQPTIRKEPVFNRWKTRTLYADETCSSTSGWVLDAHRSLVLLEDGTLVHTHSVPEGRRYRVKDHTEHRVPCACAGEYKLTVCPELAPWSQHPAHLQVPSFDSDTGTPDCAQPFPDFLAFRFRQLIAKSQPPAGR